MSRYLVSQARLNVKIGGRDEIELDENSVTVNPKEQMPDELMDEQAFK